MPTTSHKDEEINKVYEQLKEVIENIKDRKNLIVLEDWNAVIGDDII